MLKKSLRVLTTIEEVRELKLILSSLDSKVISVDTETTGLKWYNSSIVSHCIAYYKDDTYYGYYIPVRHGTSMTGEVPVNIDSSEVEDILRTFYEDPNYRKVMFNAKFDINMLHNSGINCVNCDDAMLLMFLRNENEQNHKLATMAAKYLDDAKDSNDYVAAYVKKFRIFKEPKTSYGNIPISLLGPYGANDAVLTLALWLKFGDKFITPEESPVKDGLRYSIYEHERNYAFTVANMERVGFPYDKKVGEEIAPILEDAMILLEAYIFQIAGCQFNIESSVDVSRLLKKLGLESTKTSDRTSKEVWGRDELMATDTEIGECIACYRNLSHNYTTITDGIPKWIVDGRLYCTYNQIGARTGRASASEPNLQAIPKRLPRYTKVPDYANVALKRAFELRKAFKAPPGFTVLSADQSQFELRVLDHFAQDPVMHLAFIEGRDVHTHVASVLFSKSYDDFVKLLEDKDPDAKRWRDIAKEISFAILYGAGLKRLRSTLAGYGLKFSISEVKQFYLRYMDSFIKIRQFIDTVQMTIRRRGYIFNHYGRHKRIPVDLAYVAVNHLIQGLTADMLKECKMRIEAMLSTSFTMNQTIQVPKTKLMMAVHDEIDFLLADGEEFLIPKIKLEMEDFPWCKTPIVVDISKGPSWGELEKINV